MFLLGRYQTLIIDHLSDIGAFLREGDGTDTVLLPKRQLPEGAREGDLVHVFLYKDSEDRLIATTIRPKLTVGEMALLTVKQVGKIGAFLDWGLAKDLLLPFREMQGEVKPGQGVLVALYVDRSQRLAATMRIDRHLRSDSPYRQEDQVEGTVYAVSDAIGALVAVDNQYFGLVPKQELFEKLRPGDAVKARVLRVREDGKLDLSLRKKAYAQMDEDARKIMEHLSQAGGILGIGDKSDAALIQTELSLSKNAFKRAAGRLLKEGRIRIFDDHIEAVEGF